MDTALLAEALIWIVLRGGAGVITYALWEKLEQWFPKLAKLPSDLESYITYALTGLIAVGAYLFQVWIGYAESPATNLGWAEAIFAVLGLALGVIRLLHGQKKRKAQEPKCC